MAIAPRASREALRAHMAIPADAKSQSEAAEVVIGFLRASHNTAWQISSDARLTASHNVPPNCHATCLKLYHLASFFRVPLVFCPLGALLNCIGIIGQLLLPPECLQQVCCAYSPSSCPGIHNLYRYGPETGCGPGISQV